VALTAAHLVTMTAAIALIGTACPSRSERNVLIMTGVVLHLTARSTRKHRAVLRNALNLVPEVAPLAPRSKW